MGVADALVLVGPWILGLAAVLTAAVSLWRTRSQNRRDDSDASKSAAEAMNLLWAPLRAEVASLRDEVAALKLARAADRANFEQERQAWVIERAAWEGEKRAMQAQLDEMNGGLAVLVAQLEGINIIPRYKPKTGPLPNG